MLDERIIMTITVILTFLLYLELKARNVQEFGMGEVAQS